MSQRPAAEIYAEIEKLQQLGPACNWGSDEAVRAQALFAEWLDSPGDESRIRVVNQRSKGDPAWKRINIQRGKGERPLANHHLIKDSTGKPILDVDGKPRTAATVTAMWWEDFGQQVLEEGSPQQLKVLELQSLLEQGEQIELGCCGDENCHGHMIRQELIIRVENDETLHPTGAWLWDQLDSIVAPAVVEMEEPEPDPPSYMPMRWIGAVENLLNDHYGDCGAFTFKEDADGPAAVEGFDLWSQWSFLDWGDTGQTEQWFYAQFLHGILEDHLDPERTISNFGLKRQWGDKHRELAPATFEDKKEFLARCELLQRRWGMGYALKDENKPDTFENRIYLSCQESLKWHKAGAPTGAERTAQEFRSIRKPFSVLIDDLYNAVVDEDEDKEMTLRAELYESYRIREQNIDTRLFKVLQNKALGFKPFQRTKRKRRGVSLKKLTGTEWKLPGFLPANDITLVWGMRGSGKTRLALEMGIAEMRGTGFLDRTTKAEQSKVLFIASDSGGDPLKEELQVMGLDVDNDPLFSEDSELWELWCYSQEEQQSAWGCGIRGRIELFEWAKENPGAVVMMDSAKAITAKGDCDYTDNATVTEFMTFLKECICQYVTVVVIAHDGTRKDRAGGAAAWEEIPSMVLSAQKVKDDDGREQNGNRLLTVHKSRKADERAFFYQVGEDGRLECCMGTDVIGDLRTSITNLMVERLDAGHGATTTDQIVELLRSSRFSLSKKSVQNNISNLLRGKTPKLLRVPSKQGTFKVNPYWLRSTR